MDTTPFLSKVILEMNSLLPSHHINSFICRYGKAACAKVIVDVAPDIVNTKDAEGNTAHMLSGKEPAGAPCKLLLGKEMPMRYIVTK